MNNRQSYSDGFLQGWQSIVGLENLPSEIPPTSVRGSGSPFIYGLMDGIEAGKERIAVIMVPANVTGRLRKSDQENA